MHSESLTKYEYLQSTFSSAITCRLKLQKHSTVWENMLRLEMKKTLAAVDAYRRFLLLIAEPRIDLKRQLYPSNGLYWPRARNCREYALRNEKGSIQLSSSGCSALSSMTSTTAHRS